MSSKYGTQFHKNKKTVAALNFHKYGNYTCELCKKAPLYQGTGDKMDREKEKDGVLLTIDHIKPISKGGKHGLYNLRVCCNACNADRGNND